MLSAHTRNVRANMKHPGTLPRKSLIKHHHLCIHHLTIHGTVTRLIYFIYMLSGSPSVQPSQHLPPAPLTRSTALSICFTSALSTSTHTTWKFVLGSSFQAFPDLYSQVAFTPEYFCLSSTPSFGFNWWNGDYSQARITRELLCLTNKIFHDSAQTS